MTLVRPRRMTRTMLFVSSLILAAAAVTIFVPNGARTIGVLTMVSVGAFAFTLMLRCRHASPALLPPTTALDGSRVAARWCCHECGKTWPAAFEHDTRPIQKYSGYDESKAIAAARRAEHLSKQQRDLAVRRSGLAGRPSARKVARPVSADVVAITRAHRMAK